MSIWAVGSIKDETHEWNTGQNVGNNTNLILYTYPGALKNLTDWYVSFYVYFPVNHLIESACEMNVLGKYVANFKKPYSIPRAKKIRHIEYLQIPTIVMDLHKKKESVWHELSSLVAYEKCIFFIINCLTSQEGYTE